MDVTNRGFTICGKLEATFGEKKLIPCLKRKEKIVVCDRFVDVLDAYQGVC